MATKPGMPKPGLPKPDAPAGQFLAGDSEEDIKAAKSKLVEGAIWVAAGRWGTLLISWPITILLARLLTPEDYGYVALVAVFTKFAALVAEGGISDTVVLGESLSEENYRRIHGWSISFYMVSCTILVLAATPIEMAYGTPGLRHVIWALTITVLLQGVNLVPVARMRRDLRLRELSIFNAILILTDGVVAVACAVSGLRYWSLILGFIAARIVYTGLIFRAYTLRPMLPRVQGLQDTLKNARRLLVASITSFLAQSSDAWIGAAVAGKTALGGYTYMVSLARAPLDKVSGILMYVTGSALGNIRDDHERMSRALQKMIRFSATLIFPVFVGMMLVGPDFVTAVLGEKWVPYIPALQVYCLFAILLPVKETLSRGTVAVGGADVAAKLGMALLVVLPASFYFLGGRYGATGLAASWLLTIPLIIGGLLTYLRSRIGFGLAHFSKAMGIPFLNVIIMAVAVIGLGFLPQVREAHPLVRMALQSSLGAVVYVALVLRVQKGDIIWILNFAGDRVPAWVWRFVGESNKNPA